jgi:hypothetical protein
MGNQRTGTEAAIRRRSTAASVETVALAEQEKGMTTRAHEGKADLIIASVVLLVAIAISVKHPARTDARRSVSPPIRRT